MLKMYAFYDVKSDVFSNHFVSADPFEKIKQSISISLLQLSLKDPTNPFVLYSKDWRLVCVDDEVPDVLHDSTVLPEVVTDPLFSESLDVLLTASRKAYVEANNHTSPSDELDKKEE